MVDFIEQVHLGLISPRPYRTGGDCWMLTQDCAALVLGYYPISLREKDRCRFHLSRVGEADGRLIQSTLQTWLRSGDVAP